MLSPGILAAPTSNTRRATVVWCGRIRMGAHLVLYALLALQCLALADSRQASFRLVHRLLSSRRSGSASHGARQPGIRPNNYTDAFSRMVCDTSSTRSRTDQSNVVGRETKCSLDGVKLKEVLTISSSFFLERVLGAENKNCFGHAKPIKRIQCALPAMGLSLLRTADRAFPFHLHIPVSQRMALLQRKARALVENCGLLVKEQPTKQTCDRYMFRGDYRTLNETWLNRAMARLFLFGARLAFARFTGANTNRAVVGCWEPDLLHAQTGYLARGAWHVDTACVDALQTIAGRMLDNGVATFHK
eukprot:scpid68815/ scgid3737/ 